MTASNTAVSSRYWLRLLVKLSKAAVGIIFISILALGALICWPLPKTPNNGKHGDFIVRNVSVVDVVDGRIVRRKDVVVRGGRIAAITDGGSTAVRGDAVIVDGDGKYLMPSLWDMHVHSLKISPQYSHPLSIANGITGVREMWGCPGMADSFVACGEDVERWRKELGDHSGLSPRYIMRSSYAVNGAAGVPTSAPAFFKARDAVEARSLVAHGARSGVDLIKVYTNVSPESYEALSVEASKRRLLVAGHLPVRVPLRKVLAAGQHSVEHPRVFLLECFRGAAQFRNLPDPMASYTVDMRARLIDEHDASFCAKLMADMAASETWWTPTMQVLRMSALASHREFRDDPRKRYIPFALWMSIWSWDADSAAARSRNASGRHVDYELYEAAKKSVRNAHDAGVRIVAGTDSGDTYVFPGFAIHDELRELVASGLSPLDALQTATIDAARFAGKESDYGSIAVGKVADMILLDENPLTDVGNAEKISGLFFNGQYFDRAALDELLMFAEEQAASFRTNLQLLWGGLRSPIIWAQAGD